MCYSSEDKKVLETITGGGMVRCGAMFLRGSRSLFAPAVPESPPVLVVAEARIQ